MILDIILVALVVLCYITGAKKGLVKSIWKTAAWILTIALVWVFANPFLQFASQTQIYQKLNIAVNEKIVSTYQSEMPDMPEYMEIVAEESNEAAQNAATAASDVISNVCVYIVLFVLIRLLIGLVLGVLDMLAKLPVISFTNSLAGGLLGVVNVMFVIEIILALLSVFAIREATVVIESSQVVKYLYDNNILLKFFI